MIKKTIMIFSLFIATVFSQKLFFEKEPDNPMDDVYWITDVNYVREIYRQPLSMLTDVFFSNVFKALLGEKELLGKELDIFALAQVHDKNYLRMLRNMIYAKHGLIFKSDSLNTYFKKIDWYKPMHENVDPKLNVIDKGNVKMILAFEGRDENVPDIDFGKDKERVGIWQDEKAIGSGWSNRFVIYPNNRMEYHASQMDHLKILLSMAGVYSIKGNVLEFRVNEIEYNMLHNFGVSHDSNGHWWDSSSVNKIKIEMPIIYKLPVSSMSTVMVEEVVGKRQRPQIIIGGKEFYKLAEDPNDKH